MKKANADFQDSTGSWFIAGLDSDHLAQLHGDASDDDEPKCTSAWAAMMMRLHQLLRRN